MKKHISDLIPPHLQSKRTCVNVNNSGDTRLFIDPLLITSAAPSPGQEFEDAYLTYCEDVYDSLVKDDRARLESLLDIAHEKDATRLGFGEQFGGKGASPALTADQFRDLFKSLGGARILKYLDLIPYFQRGFGPDRLSDLATGILFYPLLKYTEEEISRCSINLPKMKVDSIKVWDSRTKSVVTYSSELYNWDGVPLLLVPNSIVSNGNTLTPLWAYRTVVLDIRKDKDSWPTTNTATGIRKSTKKEYMSEHKENPRQETEKCIETEPQLPEQLHDRRIASLIKSLRKRGIIIEKKTENKE